MNVATRDREHVVYRLYRDDALLYIGATRNLASRLREHRCRTPWFGEVNRVDSTPYPNRDSALAAEAVAIQEEQPRHNVVHTGRMPPKPVQHGYTGYSTNGCRCPVCKRAKADYIRERRAAARTAAQSGVKVSGILHGSRAGYEEHGCRCGLCMKTRAVYGHRGRKQAEAPRRNYRRGAAA